MSEETTPVAFIAGASGAIGAASARKLAEFGYDLALTYRSNEESARELAAEVEALGRRAPIFQVQLDDYGQVQKAIEETVEQFGRLDTTVYAAGPYLHQRWVTEFEPEQVAEAIRADTSAAWNTFHASLLHLRKTKGSIVSVSTPAVRRHARKDLLSSAPKAAIEAMIRAIASEEGRFGVRANAVGVGTIDDGAFSQLVEDGEFDEQWVATALKVVSLGRLGSANDIASAIAFLARDETAGYITGQTLIVDGGYAL